MSSSSRHQQYLTSVDLDMIGRVHDRMAAFGADGLFTVIVPTNRLYEMAGRLRSENKGHNRQDAMLSIRRRCAAA